MKSLRPLAIALVGKTNVGKSTLFNALTGKKLSIVSHRANTTRQQLQGYLGLDYNLSIQCLDTPGIRLIKGMDSMDLRLMRRAVVYGIDSAQLFLFVTEGLQWDKDDQSVFADLLANSNECLKKKIFWVINKVDSVHPKEKFLTYLTLMQKRNPSIQDVFLVSAKKKSGIERLKQAILLFFKETFQHKLFQTPQQSFNQNFIEFQITESVRQQIYNFYHAEIPYMVDISTHEESKGFWHVTLLVDRLSQKKIIMGREGKKLETVKEKTDHRLKKIFKEKITLKWFVSIKKQKQSIRSNTTQLQSICYSETEPKNDFQ